MRTVTQRVSSASVMIDGVVNGEISQGLLILLGIETEDTIDDSHWLANKIVNLRIFCDDKGQMNKDILSMNGDILLISQFTLHASYRKGNRPSFIKAARPEQAIPLYEAFIAQVTALLGKPIQTGVFGADMNVSLVNEGPVTIVMDSKHRE